MDAEHPAPRPPGLLDRFLATPFTWFIIGINIAVFIKAEMTGSTLKDETLLQFGAVERLHVWAGQYWRLLTCTVLHIGWIHLVVNTVFGYTWCVTVERIFGSWKFMLLYVATGIGASAFSVLGHDAISAGASGSLFGVIGATMVLRARLLGGLRQFLADPPSKNLLVTIAFWFFLGATMLPMDNYAHLGGLVFGVAIAAVYLAPRSRRVVMAGALTLMWVGAVGASLHPWGESRGILAFEDGNRRLDEKKPAEAIEAYNRAEELGFREPELYFNRGLAWEQRGDIEKARGDFQKTLQVALPKWSGRADAEKWLKEHEK